MTGSLIGLTGGILEGTKFEGDTLLSPDGCSFFELSGMENFTETDKTNIAHLKKYVETDYDTISKDCIRSDTKFVGVIGFSTLLLKLSGDLKGGDSLALVLEVVTCIFFLGAVGCCLRGLRPQASQTENPRRLRNEMYSEEYKNNPEKFELGISDALMQSAEQVRKVAEEKAQYLNSAIISLSFGALLIASNIILKALTGQ